MKGFLIFISLFCQQLLLGQSRYQVVINELMADPSPVVGLPNYEWVELKNTGATAVNLRGWRLADASSQSGAFPDFVLYPDSFLIVCGAAARSPLEDFGQVLTVTGFPSLDNAGSILFLRSGNNELVHAVRYAASWYANDLKQEGGWSLEMIDAFNPCSGHSNWKASADPAGGTPGRTNTAAAPNPDSRPPQLLQAYAESASSLVLVFDEPLDSAYATVLSHYTADHGLSFVQAISPPPLDKVQLTTGLPMDSLLVYQISVELARDCVQNEMDQRALVKAGLPADPGKDEAVINEILFDPRPNAFDYVELFNAGPKILDAAKLYIANRNSNGQPGTLTVISKVPHAVFPGDHIVVTENASNLSHNYLVKNPANVFEVTALPSFPDDKGSVLLLNAQGDIIDELNYSHEWHFKLIDNAEGIALERIDAKAGTNTTDNWHSAASTAGYGTPSYSNSQHRQAEMTDAQLQVIPPVFSPDNDGYNDITSFHYKTAEQGLVANLLIFDAAGRRVRQLVRNSLLGDSGYWNWDGSNDQGQILSPGIYIILTELFNLRGQKQWFRHVVVLARKLK